MNFVTDTHPIVWRAARPQKLGRRAAAAFSAYEAGRAVLYVPAPVVLETHFLLKAGRIRGVTSIEAWWRQVSSPSMVFEPMTVEDVFAAEQLPWRHDDAFDRVIVACALRLGLPLVTADEAITASGLVDTQW